MTNRKTKTVRRIGPASSTTILPPTARLGKTGCRPATQNKASNPETRNASRDRDTIRSFPPINPLIHQSTNPSSARTRNGKVARLPHAVRDMINRMLRNNIPHSQIVGALCELNFRVTERNISNWKTRGGYRDWCIAQDRALETRLLQDNLLEHLRTNDASQLAEVGLQLVATELSQFFLKPETRQQLNAEPEKLARTIGILCRLARQIHILQKHRDQSSKELGDEHNPELVKRETDDTIESIRDIYSAEKPSESPEDPYISHRNFLTKSGYPLEPPDDTPEDNSHVDRNLQFVDDFIAQRATAQSQFSPSGSAPGTAAPGSAARAASSDSSPAPEYPHDPTSTDSESPPVPIDLPTPHS